MVANPGKFQIIFLGSNIDNSKVTFMIESKRIKSRSEVKLLGIAKKTSCLSLHILKTFASQQVTVCEL